MAQGVEWNREEVVELLRPYFQLGYNIHKACTLAQFPHSTFFTWLEQDDLLRKKVDAWQGMVSAKARENKAKEIKAGDSKSSEWWLERMDEDFSTKTKQSVDFKGELKDTTEEMPEDVKKKLAEVYEEEMRKKILSQSENTKQIN